MKNLSIILAMLILFLIGCSKKEITTECIDAMLTERNMVAYNGEDPGCKFFLELYFYQNRQFFILGNHCADMISFPIDCDGNTYCENGEDTGCRKFHRRAERIGIVGIGQ